MSEEALNDIRVLLRSMEQHAAFVEERMATSGLPIDHAVALSVAKYWDALEKLAAE